MSPARKRPELCGPFVNLVQVVQHHNAHTSGPDMATPAIRGRASSRAQRSSCKPVGEPPLLVHFVSRWITAGCRERSPQVRISGRLGADRQLFGSSARSAAGSATVSTRHALQAGRPPRWVRWPWLLQTSLVRTQGSARSPTQTMRRWGPAVRAASRPPVQGGHACSTRTSAAPTRVSPRLPPRRSAAVSARLQLARRFIKSLNRHSEARTERLP